MIKFARMLGGTALLLIAATQARAQEPLKVALIEMLSGPNAATGTVYVSAAKYEIDKLNEAGGYNGKPIVLLTYDNQGTPAGAADKVTAAINDGARVIVQGVSFAISGQITDDVRRYNLRHPADPVIFLNAGSEAGPMTGDKCHFYHFKFAADAASRMRAIGKVFRDRPISNGKVFLVNQNVLFGQEMEAASRGLATEGGLKVVDSVLHEPNKLQDFSPLVARIAASGADTVIIGSWGNDVLLLMKAAAEAKLKVKFVGMFFDFPGNIRSAGNTGEGTINIEVFNPENGGEAGMAYGRDFKAKTGAWPYAPQDRTVFTLAFLGEALKLTPIKEGKISIKDIAFSLEKASYNAPHGKISMRREDHQAIVPIAISEVSRKAAEKLEGTDFGLAPIANVSGEDSIAPLQASCKMVRPD
jgi:branched-chain amino acid transport system substrate-binding protein